CMYRFKQMQEQGVAILYVSHDAASMKHMCNRVAWIEAGKLEQCGDPNTVVDDYLNHLFHGVRRGAVAGDGKVRGDDDLGSRECAFVTAELFDEHGTRVDHLTAGSRCELRLMLENERMDPGGDPLLVGFSLSNVRGIAITGSNTLVNDVRLQVPPRGQRFAVRFAFTMPALAPGSYAITLTAATLDEAGQTHLCHLVPNALNLQTSNPKKVFGLLGLDCDVGAD
ncbi:MAG: Wzt carbohydrate-binding domain-containing protein, partial [Planctomycetes bacterium]|nr:Wzt carbohydrate-binding domain-containing protein [Planctomycetota bacterium]